MAEEIKKAVEAGGAGVGAAIGSVVPGVGTLIGGIGGGLVNVIGGIIGGIFGGAERDKAYDALTKANDLIQALNLPPEQATPIILQQFQQAGIYSPELLQQVEQAGSEYARIAPDTANIEAQQQALRALQERGTVGLNAEDRLAMQSIRDQVSADAESRRRSILQNMQAMGQGGGGAALAAQLQSAQSASNLESRQANQQAAIASQRALQAMQQAGSLAGDIRGQNYQQESNRAAAMDQMNRFNVQNQLAVNEANQRAANQAKMYNVEQQQAAANRNVSQSNQELMRQREAQLTDFKTKLGLAGAKAGALGGLADMYQNRAQATGSQIGGIAGGIASTLGGVGQYLNQPRAMTTQQSSNTQQNSEEDELRKRYLQAFQGEGQS